MKMMALKRVVSTEKERLHLNRFLIRIKNVEMAQVFDWFAPELN